MHAKYNVNKKNKKKRIKIVEISLQVMVGKPYLTKMERNIAPHMNAHNMKG